MGRIMFEKSWPMVGPKWKLDKIVVSMGDGQVKEFWREMSQKERQEAQKKKNSPRLPRTLPQAESSRCRRSPAL